MDVCGCLWLMVDMIIIIYLQLVRLLNKHYSLGDLFEYLVEMPQ